MRNGDFSKSSPLWRSREYLSRRQPAGAGTMYFQGTELASVFACAGWHDRTGGIQRVIDFGHADREQHVLQAAKGRRQEVGDAQQAPLIRSGAAFFNTVLPKNPRPKKCCGLPPSLAGNGLTALRRHRRVELGPPRPADSCQSPIAPAAGTRSSARSSCSPWETFGNACKMAGPRGPKLNPPVTPQAVSRSRPKTAANRSTSSGAGSSATRC